MPPKRRLRSSSPSSESPRKRRNTCGSDAPSSPLSISSSFPYTSSSDPAYPSDSPSNPFGRTHTYNLIQTLPSPTSFSKHLPLRFQYVKRGVSREVLDGIYRVVQVPQSYTFVHLKSLIRFLFGGAYGQVPLDVNDEAAGHVFEVKNDLGLYPSSFLPGQIMCGTTWAYSSSVLDPYLYYPDWDESEETSFSRTPESEEDVEDERKWTAEEDLTIAHVWPAGGDVSRGIVYKHSASLQIHITINTTPIEARRGKGNVPHVFSARGLVYLEDPEEEDELEEEDRISLLDPSNWNEPEDAFNKYYRQHMALPFSYTQEANASSASLPSLTFSSSPLRSSSSSSFASSSPSFATSSSSPRIRLFNSSPGSFPKYTPAPRPSQRKRIRHLQHRIGTLTRMQHRRGISEKLKKKDVKRKEAKLPIRVGSEEV
ncbi:hypothetical protein R3P38DRAFT_2903831 [Favolaschia claudopus]|uniref:Uncharacterized protein n=1 Tax=Favolaschia claudopus TaxID=2862362 RepID=A0AAW0CGT0_9AGAR